MNTVSRVLSEQPLLLLVLVLALGYPLGKLRLGRTRLGVAAVLFVGLGVGALNPAFKLHEFVYEFGLVLFVYTVGLANGSAFFASFHRQGLRDNVFVLLLLVLATLVALGLARALGLPGVVAAGMFAGSLTNTPALAAVIETIKAAGPGALSSQAYELRLAQPVVAYSVTYPMGVLGVILAIALVQRVLGIQYAREAEALKDLSGGPSKLVNRTVRVTTAKPTLSVAGLIKAYRWRVAFARLRRGGELSLVAGATRLAPGDLVSVVGTPDEVERVGATLGEIVAEALGVAGGEMDYRRIFVSNPQVAGYRLRDLNLIEQFETVVTRVRRGDSVFVPTSETVLELGDRVRVVSRRENLDAVQAFFGDSYRAASEIDVLSFALGLALGMIVGLAAVPVFGVTLRLGLAGGPLLVALFLGARGRTGPLVWTLPYSANLTLRQLGLILFLAGVGIRAGHAFLATLSAGGGPSLFLAGAGVTFATAFATLLIGRLLLHIPMGVLIGMLGGLQTQPAVLAFAHEQARNDLPNVGYATVYPVAFISKILLAQLLLSLV
jgi:putative transport protein